MRRSWAADSMSCAVRELSQKAWMVMRGTSRAPLGTSTGRSSACFFSLLLSRKFIAEASCRRSIENEAHRAAEVAARAASDPVERLHAAKEDGLGVGGDGHGVGGQRQRAVARLGDHRGHEDQELG